MQFCTALLVAQSSAKLCAPEACQAVEVGRRWLCCWARGAVNEVRVGVGTQTPGLGPYTANRDIPTLGTGGETAGIWA